MGTVVNLGEASLLVREGVDVDQASFLESAFVDLTVLSNLVGRFESGLDLVSAGVAGASGRVVSSSLLITLEGLFDQNLLLFGHDMVLDFLDAGVLRDDDVLGLILSHPLVVLGVQVSVGTEGFASVASILEGERSGGEDGSGLERILVLIADSDLLPVSDDPLGVVGVEVLGTVLGSIRHGGLKRDTIQVLEEAGGVSSVGSNDKNGENDSDSSHDNDQRSAPRLNRF